MLCFTTASSNMQIFAQGTDKVVVGYVTSWGNRMPGPTLVTQKVRLGEK